MRRYQKFACFVRFARLLPLLAVVLGWAAPLAFAEDWPLLGRDGTRNSVSTELAPPTLWRPEQRDRDGLLTSAGHGLRWSAPLGGRSYASPVISGGLAWIGSMGERPVEGKSVNHAVLQCFRVADGKRVYEFAWPSLGARVHDAGWTGLGSSPLIEGDRLWIMTNRCEVLCYDIGPLLRGEGEPRELWKLDCIKQFDFYPRVTVMGPPRPCSIGPSWNGRIFVTLHNGVDESQRTIPKPDAPSLVCLSKETGEVFWKDNSPGKNILVSQFASPTIAEIKGQTQVIVPQSDGWLRSFEPETGKVVWEFDVNLKESLFGLGGQGTRNDLYANAVVYEDRVYIASGQGAEEGEGSGRLVCVDPTKRGDVSSELAVDEQGKPLPKRRLQAVDAKAGEKAIPNPNSALVWEFTKSGDEFEDTMHRMLSSVSVAKGLVIAADSTGLVHCFDARTGKRHWHYDALAFIWGTPLIVDDRVFVADEDGELGVFQLGADPKHSKPLRIVEHPNPIRGSLAYAEGTLYVPTEDSLIAVDAALAQRWREGLGHWPQWRGPQRDNKSTETGLLESWPAEGPPLAWRVDGLGDGIASLALVDGRILTTTTYGNSEYAVALDSITGGRLWAERIGAAVEENPLMRWLSQRSPTVDGQQVFVYSNTGWLVCLDAWSGYANWRVSYPHEFGTSRGKWGFCDRPLVDGDHLICTPGGTKATVAALDKRTGKVVWSRLFEGREASGYAATIVVDTDGLRQYVVTLDKGLAGLAADDGRLLWRYANSSNGTANSYTPLVTADGLLCPNGYGSGVARIRLTRDGDGVRAEEVFSKRENLDPFEDSTVLVEDRLYAFARQGVFVCLNALDGKHLDSSRGSGAGKAAATYADGRLYVRWSNGVLALLDTAKAGYSERGSFKLPEPRNSIGSTFPVIAGRRLYVRDNDRLYCYDIEQHPADYVQPKSHVIEHRLPRIQAASKTRVEERVPNAIFVPTPDDVVDKMLAAANVGKDDIVYDLGSGDGRIVIQAAKTFACRGIGLELDRDLVDLSKTRVAEAKLQKLVTIKQTDLFEADFRDATVVTVFLYPGLLKRLLPKFELLKPGTRIVSHQFEIPDFPPERTITVESQETGAKHKVYLWTTPLKK